MHYSKSISKQRKKQKRKTITIILSVKKNQESLQNLDMLKINSFYNEHFLLKFINVLSIKISHDIW